MKEKQKIDDSFFFHFDSACNNRLLGGGGENSIWNPEKIIDCGGVKGEKTEINNTKKHFKLLFFSFFFAGAFE
jgi:hypothetical protein